MPRLLVVRPDRLGDFVLTLPMIAALRAGRPGDEVHALLAPRVAPLAACVPEIDRVLVDPGGYRALATAVGAGGYDLAVFPYAKAREALAVWWAGVPRRVGNGLRPFSPLFTDRVPVHRSRPPLHEADYCLALLAPLGLPGGDGAAPLPALRAPDAAGVRARLGLGGRPYVLVHPGGGGSAGRPTARDFGRFAAAARDAAAPGAVIAVSAGPGETDLAEETAAACGGRALPVVPELADYLALAAAAEVYLGGSTGPLHIAAAGGAPTLGFYPLKASQTAARWAPRGRRTATLSPPVGDCADCAAARCVAPGCFGRVTDAAVAAAARALRSD